MMIVYNKQTGFIIASISDDQDVQSMFFHYSQEFKDNLATINVDNCPRNLRKYKISDGQLVRLSDIESEELRRYKRVLTEEERLLEKMKPSKEEIPITTEQIIARIDAVESTLLELKNMLLTHINRG